MRDSYSLFLKKFDISTSDFLNYGIELITDLLPAQEVIASQWADLKNEIRVERKGYRRNYGREKSKNNGMSKNDRIDSIIKSCYGIQNVIIDQTNNAEPTKIINKYSGYKKNRDIVNYKVSHIWGKTLNPYCFKSLWNIAFIPIIYDPFTGHESKSDMCNEFAKELKSEIFKRHERQIDEFNKIIKSTLSNVAAACEKIEGNSALPVKDKERLIQDIKDNFGQSISAVC